MWFDISAFHQLKFRQAFCVWIPLSSRQIICSDSLGGYRRVFAQVTPLILTQRVSCCSQGRFFRLDLKNGSSVGYVSFLCCRGIHPGVIVQNFPRVHTAMQHFLDGWCIVLASLPCFELLTKNLGNYSWIWTESFWVRAGNSVQSGKKNHFYMASDTGVLHPRCLLHGLSQDKDCYVPWVTRLALLSAVYHAEW